MYGTIRTVDLGKESPEAGEVEHSRDVPTKKLKIRIQDAAWLTNLPTTPTDDVSGPAVASPVAPTDTPAPEVASTETATAPAQISSAPAVASPPPAAPSYANVVTVRIRRLTEETVDHVWHACVLAGDNENGSVLRLLDGVGTPLIDPSLRIRINVQKFVDILDKQYNLGDGRFE